jgi:hypothetical protein
MTRRILTIVTAAVILLSITAYAHHSVGATYDSHKEVKVEGKLVQFLFRNPHSFVHVEAPDEKGVMQRWAVEWSGASSLGGQGVSSSTLQVGDEVIITGNPARSVTEAYRLKMNTLLRKKDGFKWGTRPGEVVD